MDAVTLPAVDLAEAWQELERMRRAGWYVAMNSSIDHGWSWTASRATGRRFRTTVRAADHDPVVAITRLVIAMENTDRAMEDAGA